MNMINIRLSDVDMAKFWCIIWFMKTLPLTQGRVALVDDEDYDWLNQWKWSYSNHGYARRGERLFSGSYKTVHILMHRAIMHAPDGVEVDHINHDSLDNQKVNLRLASHKQNSHNLRGPRSSTGFIGVAPKRG